MKYAVPYYKDFRHFDEVDEVIFAYTNKNTEAIVENIPEVLKKQEQRAVIDISYSSVNSVLPFLLKLKEKHDNFIVKISYYENDIVRESKEEQIKLFKEFNIPFMFSDFPLTIEQIYSMAELGAKDIYIIESLGFYLKDLQPIREKYNINFRVFPDVAQCSKNTKNQIPALKRFWIRPEDTEIYEDYVDVFEFFKSNDRLSITYEIYKQRQWSGPLENLINFGDSSVRIDNSTIAPYFGQQRLNCEKKCLFGKCNVCDRIYELAGEFKEAGITVEKDIYEEYKNELKQKLYNQFMQTNQTETQDESD